MITSFISHILKRFFRSSATAKGIATQIMLGFLAIMFIGYSLAFGFALERIIVNGLNQSAPVQFLNGLLIYYFIGEFVTRFFIQSIPTLDAQPYLHLPIARSAIVNFLLGRSLAHVMNALVFLIFTPFALTAVANEYGTSQGWIWLFAVWFVSLLNHFVVILLKKNLEYSTWGMLGLIVVSGGLAASDYFGWFSLSKISVAAFGTALHGYGSVAGLFVVVGLLYVTVYRSFMRGLYPEELSVKEYEKVQQANWAFLQNFGLIGAWIKLELKLILRHKRTKSILLVNVVFIFYGLIFYTRIQNPNAYGTFLFIGILCTGIFAMNYGQFLFSWQGRHFDFTLSQPTSIRQFVESKYWLLTAVTGLWFLLSVPYVYFGWSILLINLAAALFNIGINVFVIMNMAMWSPKRIDLSRGGTFNYEGMGAAQWLMGIPVMASPYLIYLPFSLAGYPVFGLVAVGMAGLVGIIFRSKMLDITSERLSDMRYTIASNFRND